MGDRPEFRGAGWALLNLSGQTLRLGGWVEQHDMVAVLRAEPGPTLTTAARKHIDAHLAQHGVAS